MKILNNIKKKIWFSGPARDEGENFAIKYLKSRGYLVLDVNFDVHFAEIDIVAKKGKIIAFVEVKQRKSKAFGLPREAVSFEKQRKIRRAAEAYIIKNKPGLQPRFDVIEIYGSCDGVKKPEIIHLVNAF